MRGAEAELYRDPQSHVPLSLTLHRGEAGDVQEGSLVSADGSSFPIVRGIPRFCPADNYAESFGYQWQKYDTVQLDSQSSWGPVSEQRLFGETGWPRDMRGERILEAGSGMGRFTEHLAQTGATVCTFDYSVAVDANRRNNGRFENVSFAQADIYAPPYEPGSFDRVICIGVIQHCPDPYRAFLSLTRFVRPGGHIFIDVYRLFWKSFVLGKYYVRPFTRRMQPERLHRMVRWHVGWVFPLTGWIHRRIGRPGTALSWMLAVADTRRHHKTDERTALELTTLDTFDMLAPRYDKPRTRGMVRRWLKSAGLEDIRIGLGVNGVIAQGRRPAR
jgi:2-polyprenyl-3-methyl-5-hydroxy-6-metoxy-1,4-benzoquinol methylase